MTIAPAKASVLPLSRQYPGAEALGAATPVGVDDIAALIRRRAIDGLPLVVGLTGSVASGKTTLATAIAKRLAGTHHVEVVSTDGFLLSNAALAARGLSNRKGYPETYDTAWMSGFLQRLRLGPVATPGYSHTTYDLDASLSRTIDRPDIVLVEGLGLAPRPDHRDPHRLLDIVVYLDASEADLETWFAERFLQFWRAAQTDPSSFYVRFRSLSEEAAARLARSMWANVNLPNLRENISLARDGADILLCKDADHSLSLVRPSRVLS